MGILNVSNQNFTLLVFLNYFQLMELFHHQNQLRINQAYQLHSIHYFLNFKFLINFHFFVYNKGLKFCQIFHRFLKSLKIVHQF